MDEFDSLIEDAELPLHLRIAQKYGKTKSGSGGAATKDNFYVDSEGNGDFLFIRTNILFWFILDIYVSYYHLP